MGKNMYHFIIKNPKTINDKTGRLLLCRYKTCTVCDKLASLPVRLFATIIFRFKYKRTKKIISKLSIMLQPYQTSNQVSRRWNERLSAKKLYVKKTSSIINIASIFILIPTPTSIMVRQ